MADEASVPGRGGEAEAADGLRASHEDRDRVVEVLQAAAGDGRLTAEELDERLEAALTARTHGELAVLTADLRAAASASAVSPKDAVRIDCHTGTATRDGRWIVPQRIEVHVTAGSVTLDFTEAVITRPTLHIDADVSGGSLSLVTKPGIVVDTDEVAIRTGAARVVEPSGPAGPVTLRIDVSGQVVAGSLKARPPRRTFWQWLLRRPGRRAITS